MVGVYTSNMVMTMDYMNAAQISKYGGSEVIEINKVTAPSAGSGQVLVKAQAAGVNPVDWKIREGYLQQMAPLKFPATLGGDFSGTVIEAGKDVSGFKKGDEVYGTAIVLAGGSGAFAELLSTNAGLIAPKPKSVSNLEAAALPLVGVSAVQALTEHIKLSTGQKILIHGGAGGIGSVAIQVAKHLGAHVATTVNAKDIAYVKELGADEAIDYEKQRFEDALSGYDAVFDTVGGETYTRSFKALRKGGIIVSMLEKPNQELMAKHGVTAISQFTQINTERLKKLAELAEKGAVKIHIDKIFPLEKAAEALDHLKNGRPRGKVVIKII